MGCNYTIYPKHNPSFHRAHTIFVPSFLFVFVIVLRSHGRSSPHVRCSCDTCRLGGGGKWLIGSMQRNTMQKSKHSAGGQPSLTHVYRNKQTNKDTHKEGYTHSFAYSCSRIHPFIRLLMLALALAHRHCSQRSKSCAGYRIRTSAGMDIVVQSLARLSTHSSVHSFIRSFVHSFICSITHSLINPSSQARCCVQRKL